MKPATQFWIRNLPDGAGARLGDGWTSHTLIKNSPLPMGVLSVYFATLEAGALPHETHRHDEQELIVIQSGELDVISHDDVRRVGPGAVLHHPPGSEHTIRGAGENTARFFVLKWLANGPAADRDGNTWIAAGAPASAVDTTSGPRRNILGTRKLDCGWSLRVCQSNFAAGQTHPLHTHDYDVVQLLCAGQFVGVGFLAKSPSALFFAAGVLHGLTQPMPEDSLHFDLEFHRPGNIGRV